MTAPAAVPADAACAPHRDQITGLVLAGGRGARMGGADKGLVLFGDQPLVRHVVQRLAPQVAKLLISANRNIDVYRRMAEVVTDPADVEPHAGPLAGILAGLSCASTRWVAVVPCDTPYLPPDLVARLSEGLAGRAAAYVTTRERAHPLIALLHKSLAPTLAGDLRAGQRRAAEWFRSQAACAVQFDDEASFANINCAEDLDAAVKESTR
jgi:molybdopterin-guanine dinucleotide biosynthesis protein A